MDFGDPHLFVDISELPNNYDIPFLCGAHCQSKSELFCGLHNAICCKKCAVEKHVDCDSVSPLYMNLRRFQISNIVVDCQERISAVSKSLQHLIQSYNCNITSVEHHKKQIQMQIHHDYEKTISDINSSQEIENAIENDRTRLILDLKNRLKKIVFNIEEKKNQLEIVLKRTKEQEYLLKFTSKNGSEKHLFLVMKYLESLLGDSERQLENYVENRICVNLRYQKDRNDLHKSLGRVETIYNTPESIVLRHKILRESQIPVTIPMSKDLELLKWFNIYNIPDMVISGITITTSGLIILCDRGKPRIIVTNETGDKQTPLNLEFQPWEVAAIPYSEIVVIICTEYDYILFKDACKRSLSRKISFEGSAKCCIACTELYIILGGINKIDILRHKGTTAQYLQTVKINFSVKSLSFCESNDLIYFSSNGSDKLHRVDIKGKTFSPFDTKNIEIQTNLKCICVDKKSNIYFMDSTKHSVHKLSEGGEDLGIIELRVKTENTRAFTFNNDYTKLYLLEKDMGLPCISIFSQMH